MLPECITASFAFYIAFYRGQKLTDDGIIGKRDGGEYTIHDDGDVLRFYDEHKNDSVRDLVHAVCSNVSLWCEDLSLIAGFEDKAAYYLDEIREKGTYAVMKECLSDAGKERA